MDWRRRDGSFDLDSPGICLSAGNRAAMKALPAPEPEERVSVQPAEVWSPSMGTEPMPVAGEIAARSERYVCAACLQLGCPWGDVFGWVPYDERYQQRRDWGREWWAYVRNEPYTYAGISREAWPQSEQPRGEFLPRGTALGFGRPRRYYSQPWNRYAKNGRLLTYPQNPVGCPHRKKVFRAEVWLCNDCGEKVR